MSNSGNFGQRQSWRREERSEAGKRRTIKAVLTLVAVVLIGWFLFIILRPTAQPQMVTILVSNQYGTDVITPPMFGETARATIKDQLDAVDLGGAAAAIESRFHETDDVKRFLDDPDDHVMVILRGYLMTDAKGRPSLACSDLAVGESESQPQGLLPLEKVLQPLAEIGPSGFQGTRTVVLDIEPLAAHGATGQWADEVFVKLGEVVAGLSGDHASRLWVLVTRGPMQNVGWDHTTSMPLSTQILLDAFSGKADLDEDRVINLRELCGFVSDRYGRLPRNQDTETPRLVLLQGGHGLVDEKRIDEEAFDVWLARAIPEPEPEQPQETESNPDDTESPDDKASAEQTAADSRNRLEIKTVVYQGNGQTGQQNNSTEAVGNTAEASTAEGNTANSSSGAKPNATSADAAAPGNAAPGVKTASGDGADSNGDSSGAASSSEITFWDVRDEFETPSSAIDASLHPLALAPHLWRQLVVNVLFEQVNDYDPASPSSTPDQVADDLSQLKRVLMGQAQTKQINDDVVTELKRLVQTRQVQRASVRSDERLKTADQLQLAIAAARLRLWARLEFQRQAAVCNASVPEPSLYAATVQAERILVNAMGTDVPAQSTLVRQLTSLQTEISLFDRNVQSAVGQLLQRFELKDPQRTWELSRRAWAWLRSPLPTARQRRQLYAALMAAPLDSGDRDSGDRESQPVDFNAVVFASVTPSGAARTAAKEYQMARETYEQPLDPTQSERIGHAQRRAQLESIAKNDAKDPKVFGMQWSAALRIDPLFVVDPDAPVPLTHLVDPLPVVRNPTVQVTSNDGGAPTLKFETMQDSNGINLRIDPDRDQPTTLLVSYRVRTSANDFSQPPVSVRWKMPGWASVEAGQTKEIHIAAEAERVLALEVRPADVARPGDEIRLEIEVRGRFATEKLDGVVGTYDIPIQLPVENRLQLVASRYRGVGCSAEVFSDDGGLPDGMWLRTFNNRETPFQLELLNEAGKPCRAKVWLIRLPNPMENTVAYWPDVAKPFYSSLHERLLDSRGRIRERFLYEDSVLKGPAEMEIPGDRQRVKLNFSPPEPADPATASPSRPADKKSENVSHGMALVCRLIDADGNVMPEDDQIIAIVAKPWAPNNYVNASVVYQDGEVGVDVDLASRIDGDDKDDVIPGIAKVPVDIRWTQDEQWASFVAESTETPQWQNVELNQENGRLGGVIKVRVPQRRRESLVRLDVDGWPRAIRYAVEHQQRARGQAKAANEVRFRSIALIRQSSSPEPAEPESYFAPEGDVYLKGGGHRLVATIMADFAGGVFNPSNIPEVKIQVEGEDLPRYQTDRLIETEATELSDDGVIKLLTRVTDLVIDLNQGQRSDDRIPIDVEIEVNSGERPQQLVTVVLDSRDPETLSPKPESIAPYVTETPIKFAVVASDPGRDAAGVARLDIGLDADGDGKVDEQKRFHVFDPPVNTAVMPAAKATFEFATEGDYSLLVTSTDAAGNQSNNKYDLSVQKGKSADDGKEAMAKTGFLHGEISSRNIDGTLSVLGAPQTLRVRSKDISRTDRRFRFGPLPEGKYTLRFRGFQSGNSTGNLLWKDIEVDTTAGGSKRLNLRLRDAESEDD